MCLSGAARATDDEFCSTRIEFEQNVRIEAFARRPTISAVI